MQSLLLKLRLANGPLRAVFVAVCLIGATGSIAQQDSLQIPVIPPAGRVPFGKGQDPMEDENLRRIQQEAGKRRNIDRQNRIVADAARIVQLAEELDAEAEKTGEDKLPPALAKKAEEIEKLAKAVKDRMKG